jgi:hypothetical protein
MSVLHPSSIRPFFMFKPHHHAFPNASSPKRETALLPNDDVLPTTSFFTESFEENFLPNGASFPNSAHKSVPFLYQFLVLTEPHSLGGAVDSTEEDGRGRGRGASSLQNRPLESRAIPVTETRLRRRRGRRKPDKGIEGGRQGRAFITLREKLALVTGVDLLW